MKLLRGRYNWQYGARDVGVMLTNLLGPTTHYDLNNSYDLPALIRKAHEAKLRGDKKFMA